MAADLFGVLAGDLTRLAGVFLVGDLALEGDLLLAGVFFLELVAAFLVGDLALEGDLALAGVLRWEARKGSASEVGRRTVNGTGWLHHSLLRWGLLRGSPLGHSGWTLRAEEGGQRRRVASHVSIKNIGVL